MQRHGHMHGPACWVPRAPEADLLGPETAARSVVRGNDPTHIRPNKMCQLKSEKPRVNRATMIPSKTKTKTKTRLQYQKKKKNGCCCCLMLAVGSEDQFDRTAEMDQRHSRNPTFIKKRSNSFPKTARGLT